MSYVVDIKNIVTQFGDTIVHDKISLHVNEGEIYTIVGPSGCGKTTLLREMVALESFKSGSIEILGYDLSMISYKELQLLRKSWGFLFQSGALFSSLSVFDNIALPLYEYTNLDKTFISKIVAYKLELVGLRETDAFLYPSQISGGMIKKVALARALALEPKLLFLDEPTSGLDPISAREFDSMILRLRDFLSLSLVVVSHDLTSLRLISDKIAVMDEKKIIAEGNLAQIMQIKNNFIEKFFNKDLYEQ